MKLLSADQCSFFLQVAIVLILAILQCSFGSPSKNAGPAGANRGNSNNNGGGNRGGQGGNRGGNGNSGGVGYGGGGRLA